MASIEDLKKVLRTKEAIYRDLHGNLIAQKDQIAANKLEAVIEIQTQWVEVCKNLELIDLKIEQMFKTLKPELLPEILPILLRLENRGQTLRELNKANATNLTKKIEELKLSLENIEIGQNALKTYKKPVEQISVYIDKKS